MISHTYIHYPFCQKLCHYCNFSAGVAPNTEFMNTYHAALLQEIEYHKHFYDFSQVASKSLYLGGGTPSLMPEQKLEQLFSLIPIHPESEVTLEVNPETVTKDKALFWKSLGINRVSLGWQSMNSSTLSFLGRNGSSKQNLLAFDVLRSVGFNNISIDRILSITGDTDHDFFDALKTHKPDHVSTYQLSIENKTVLQHWTKINKYAPMADQQALEIEKKTDEYLTDLGFSRYETSNYERNSNEGKHNIGYWDYDYWIGIGASAAGFLPNDSYGTHYRNHFSFHAYCKQPTIPEEVELLSLEITIKEALMLGIRKRKGIDKRHFEKRIGLLWSDIFDTYCSSDYFLEDENSLILKYEAIPLTNPAILSLWKNINKKILSSIKQHHKY